MNLLPGQDVLTVSEHAAKIEALLRGLGCGFIPEPMVREHLARRHLVAKATRATERRATTGLRLALRQRPQTRGLGLGAAVVAEAAGEPDHAQALLERQAGPLR